jgi:MFS transporter, MHS family, proline/betaine transporter
MSYSSLNDLDHLVSRSGLPDAMGTSVNNDEHLSGDEMASHAINVSDVRTRTPDEMRRARRAVTCTILGNALEWFDFATYAYFATVFSRLFFPSADRSTALIATFAVFGIGFVSRPLGAVFFGRLGDLKGRKHALLIAMPLMGVGTTLIGMLPTYAEIGIAAPLLLVACRLLQGFSAGGEAGNAMAYLVEWAPANRRAFFSCLVHATSVGGTLLGSGIAAALSTTLDQASLESWGWRLPFFFGGLVIAPVGYYLRTMVEETPRFVAHEVEAQHALAADEKKSAWLHCAKAIGLTSIWFVSYYVFMVYTPAYLTVHGHIERASALWITTAGFIVMTFSIVVSGLVSDIVGRKPMLISGALSFIVLAYPLFLLFKHTTSTLAIMGAVALCSALIGIFAGTCPATMAEMFPTRVRTTGISIGYGLSVAIFGGFASVISETLIKVTGSELSPSYFVIAAAVLALAVAVSIKETAHASLR